MAKEQVLMKHPKTKAERLVSRRSFERVWSNPDAVEIPWVEVKPDKTKKENE